MLIVGLTGGIATGKSTVTALLREQGVTVIDCDEIAHAVVRQAGLLFLQNLGKQNLSHGFAACS